MSRVPSLSSPFLLGFDEIERALDRVAKASEGYPPYNIERLARDADSPERLRITLAVARPRTTGWTPPGPPMFHEGCPGGHSAQGNRYMVPTAPALHDEGKEEKRHKAVPARKRGRPRQRLFCSL